MLFNYLRCVCHITSLNLNQSISGYTVLWEYKKKKIFRKGCNKNLNWHGNADMYCNHLWSSSQAIVKPSFVFCLLGALYFQILFYGICISVKCAQWHKYIICIFNIMYMVSAFQFSVFTIQSGTGPVVGLSQSWSIVSPFAESKKGPNGIRPDCLQVVLDPRSTGELGWSCSAQSSSGSLCHTYLWMGDLQNSVCLRDSCDAAVHIAGDTTWATGWGGWILLWESVWLMWSQLRGNVCVMWHCGERLSMWRLWGLAEGQTQTKPARQAEHAPSNIFSLVTAVCVTLNPRAKMTNFKKITCNSTIKSSWELSG